MKRKITMSQTEDGQYPGGLTVTIEDLACFDCTIEGWRGLIEGALTGLGFHPESVKEAFDPDAIQEVK